MKILLFIILSIFYSKFIISQGLDFEINWTAESFFEVGSIQDITWSSEDIDSINIDYSTDGGKTWKQIIKVNASSFLYSWTIPNDPSLHCQIRIVDSKNSNLQDQIPYFDEYFVIYGKNTVVSIEELTNQNFHSISFNDNMHGIAWNNTVLFSTLNGGLSWELESEYDNGHTHFINRKDGWAIDASEINEDSLKIGRTYDGGINWIFKNAYPKWIFPNGENILKEIVMKNNQLGYAIGISKDINADPSMSYQGFILKTIDGYSWEKVYSKTGAQFYELKVVDSLCAYISYEKEFSNGFCMTEDGGKNWYEFGEREIFEESIKYIFAKGKNLVALYYNTASYGMIEYFDFNELLWDKQFLAYGLHYRNGFFQDSLGIITGVFDHRFDDRFIIITRDNGKSWQLVNLSSHGAINDFFLLDGKTIWAACNSGTLLKYEVHDLLTSIETGSKKLSSFYLSQNYPNPFNPSTTIKFGLPNESKVSLVVFNILGQEVTRLVNQKLKAGYHEVEFNNSNYSSGIYFYRLQATPSGGQAGDYIETKKMILLK